MKIGKIELSDWIKSRYPIPLDDTPAEYKTWYRALNSQYGMYYKSDYFVQIIPLFTTGPQVWMVVFKDEKFASI